MECPRLHGRLSPKIRRLRLEALAQGLRKFNLVDDGTLSELVTRRNLPTIAGFARALRESDQRLRLPVSASFVAASVLSHVGSKEHGASGYEDWVAGVSVPHQVTAENFHGAVAEVLANFKRGVEHLKGYTLLWDGHRAKSEKEAQALFALSVKGWCASLGIDLQSEVNLGRGPVDFRMSTGPALRTVIEMKLARHKRYWDGLTKQLPAYMTADDVRIAYFVTISFTEADERRLGGIAKVIEGVRQRTGYEVHSITVDARRDNKPSASKL